MFALSCSLPSMGGAPAWPCGVSGSPGKSVKTNEEKAKIYSKMNKTLKFSFYVVRLCFSIQ
jgi:hypothetical protein